jgi:hypothetical protein
MSPTDVYRLAMPTGYRVLVVTCMVVLSLFGVGMLVMTLTGGVRSVHLPLILFWCAALAWNWYILLGIPYEIRFEAPGLLSFVSLRGTTSLAVTTLHSLKPYRGGGGVYVLHHEGGTIRVIAQITGFHEAVTRIKAINPDFEVVGI